MAQRNRSKEVWLIPKRVNLHQTICLLDGIIERNYDKTGNESVEIITVYVKKDQSHISIISQSAMN